MRENGGLGEEILGKEDWERRLREKEGFRGEICLGRGRGVAVKPVSFSWRRQVVLTFAALRRSCLELRPR